MNLRVVDWKFWAAVFAALFLFALAASTPAWVAHVPGAKLTSVDPQVVLGLVAVVFGILALVGGAVYYLLKAEVQETIRRQIVQESVLPLHITAQSLASFLYYLEYSGMWRQTGGTESVIKDPGFQWAVLEAVRTARIANQLAQTLPSGPRHRNQQLTATDTLAYHLATQYLFERDDRARREALSLMGEIKTEQLRGHEFEETAAWVQVVCHDQGTQEFEEGLKVIKRLLTYRDIPLQWRQVLYRKYTKVLNIDLPFPFT